MIVRACPSAVLRWWRKQRHPEMARNKTAIMPNWISICLQVADCGAVRRFPGVLGDDGALNRLSLLSCRDINPDLINLYIKNSLIRSLYITRKRVFLLVIANIVAYISQTLLVLKF